jgi:hypothetical protein
MGREGGVMTISGKFLAVAVATSLLWPLAAVSKPAAKHPTKLTVHPKAKSKAKGHRWRGYGFLPGYRPQLAEFNGLPVLGPDPRRKREPRYFDWDGNVRYGWGAPGFYRGRWNGGSFGPCWTYTPIGMMNTCGGQ